MIKNLAGSALFWMGLTLGVALSWLPRSALLQTAQGADSAGLAARVQALEDHLAIEELLMEYGVTLDKRDFAAYSHLFAREGTWTGNIGTFKGPAAIQEAMEKAFGRADSPITNGSFHLLTNPIIHVQGDHGTALSKWTFCRMDNGKPVIVMSGRYEDTLVRENGIWRFQSRVAPAATAK
jgi:SnoaL-like domain